MPRPLSSSYTTLLAFIQTLGRMGMVTLLVASLCLPRAISAKAPSGEGDQLSTLKTAVETHLQARQFELVSMKLREGFELLQRSNTSALVLEEWTATVFLVLDWLPDRYRKPRQDFVLSELTRTARGFCLALLNAVEEDPNADGKLNPRCQQLQTSPAAQASTTQPALNEPAPSAPPVLSLPPAAPISPKLDAPPSNPSPDIPSPTQGSPFKRRARLAFGAGVLSIAGGIVAAVIAPQYKRRAQAQVNANCVDLGDASTNCPPASVQSYLRAEARKTAWGYGISATALVAGIGASLVGIHQHLADRRSRKSAPNLSLSLSGPSPMVGLIWRFR